MCHVGFDEVTSSQSTAETEFASQNGCRDDAGELAGVVARVAWVWAFHAEEVEHGHLRFEDCAAADGADFDGGHRYT